MHLIKGAIQPFSLITSMFKNKNLAIFREQILNEILIFQWFFIKILDGMIITENMMSMKLSLDCSFGPIKVYFDNAKLNNGRGIVRIDASFSGVELYT